MYAIYSTSTTTFSEVAVVAMVMMLLCKLWLQLMHAWRTTADVLTYALIRTSATSALVRRAISSPATPESVKVYLYRLFSWLTDFHITLYLHHSLLCVAW